MASPAARAALTRVVPSAFGRLSRRGARGRGALDGVDPRGVATSSSSGEKKKRVGGVAVRATTRLSWSSGARSFAAAAHVDDGELPPHPIQTQRVSKLMSQRGMASRREAEALIDRGDVIVNGGEVATRGMKVAIDATIDIAGDSDGGANALLAKKVTVVLNKPPGYVSNLPSRGEREASELITPRNAIYHHSTGGGVVGGGADADAATRRKLEDVCRDARALNVCGRLDKDSRGLLVLTTDGVLARAIVGGNEIPRCTRSSWTRSRRASSWPR